jgi:hypothetical protein
VDHSKNKTNEDIHIRSEKENYFGNVIFTKKDNDWFYKRAKGLQSSFTDQALSSGGGILIVRFLATFSANSSTLGSTCSTSR